MAIRIESEFMILEVDGAIVATALLSRPAAAFTNSEWIASTHPARVFTRDQAITALTLAERFAAGYGDDDPFIEGWRAELSR